MANLLKIVNRFAVLKQLPIFSKLKWFELQKIAYKCSFVEYKKGEIICKEGAPPDAFYCVVSGRVQAYIIRGNSEKRNIEFIYRGMYFGIISLLTGENHSMTFEALNDSVILKIDKADFSAILDLVPRLGIEFSHSLSRRLRSRDSSKSIFESNIISIYSPVRASGSSTFAINLAFNLEKETKKKVILVHITSLIEQLASQKTGGEASPTWKKDGIELKNIAGDHNKIIQSISRGELKVDLLNVNFDPRDYWLINQISHFVSLLANDYHFVVVDLPSDMDEVVLKTLTQSDMVYLISVDRENDLKMTNQVLDKLKEAHKEKFQKEKIQVIISGVQEKNQMTYEQLGKAIDYNIFRVLPHITSQQLSVAVVSNDITAIMPDLNSEYSKSVRRIARELGGVLVALVLGGGAALGVAHIGVLRVLEKENIPIDMVVGSSIGALIGGLWAIGKDANAIEAVAREFEQKKAGLKLIDALPSKSGFSGRNLTKWLRRHFADRTFYSCKIPLIVIAYDLIRREELAIAEGSLVDAVRQSVAIPGIISPIVTKDRLIIDGGVINPLPTNVASSFGIKKIIAVNVLQSPQDVVRGQEMFEKQLEEEAKIPFTKSPVKYCSVRIFRLLTKIFYPNIADIIVRGLQAVEYVIAEQSAQQADVLIRPDLVGINWFELYQVDRLVASGEEAAYRHLAEIKKLVSD